MVYQWKSGSRIAGISAQEAGEVCESLDGVGCLSAQRLVDVSRPIEAPLHKAFEWNDAVAGEEWRKHQARHIINSVVEAPAKKDDTPVRAFYKLEQAGDNYESVRTILKSVSKREALLRDALRELDAFRRKYSALQELATVFLAIDNAKMAPETEDKP